MIPTARENFSRRGAQARAFCTQVLMINWLSNPQSRGCLVAGSGNTEPQPRDCRVETDRPSKIVAQNSKSHNEVGHS